MFIANMSARHPNKLRCLPTFATPNCEQRFCLNPSPDRVPHPEID